MPGNQDKNAICVVGPAGYEAVELHLLRRSKYGRRWGGRMGWVGENRMPMDGAPVRGRISGEEITPTRQAAGKTNPNVGLVVYAIRLELLPREQEHGD